MSFFDYFKPLGTGNKAFPGLDKGVNQFFSGTPQSNYQVSTLDKSQMPIKNQLTQAAQAGPGGAFGQAQNYYSGLLSDNSADFNAFAAPEQRRFNEQIIPDLAEQFAGMGSGGLSSSGFRNAAVGAGTDLSERLGAIRANLRQNAAQGLQNIGQSSLQSFNNNITDPGSPGLLDYAAPAIGAGLTAFGGPLAGAAGSAATNWLSNSFKRPSNTSPYGGGSNGSASISQSLPARQ
jgi:hypothetical protein